MINASWAGSCRSTQPCVSGSHNCTPASSRMGNRSSSWRPANARSYSLTTIASNPRSGSAIAASSAATPVAHAMTVAASTRRRRTPPRSGPGRRPSPRPRHAATAVTWPGPGSHRSTSGRKGEPKPTVHGADPDRTSSATGDGPATRPTPDQIPTTCDRDGHHRHAPLPSPRSRARPRLSTPPNPEHASPSSVSRVTGRSTSRHAADAQRCPQRPTRSPRAASLPARWPSSAAPATSSRFEHVPVGSTA
jgi:hypothetical protein